MDISYQTSLSLLSPLLRLAIHVQSSFKPSISNHGTTFHCYHMILVSVFQCAQCFFRGPPINNNWYPVQSQVSESPGMYRLNHIEMAPFSYPMSSIVGKHCRSSSAQLAIGRLPTLTLPYLTYLPPALPRLQLKSQVTQWSVTVPVLTTFTQKGFHNPCRRAEISKSSASHELACSHFWEASS